MLPSLLDKRPSDICCQPSKRSKQDAPSPTSPLIKLPGDIQNLIYSYLKLPDFLNVVRALPVRQIHPRVAHWFERHPKITVDDLNLSYKKKQIFLSLYSKVMTSYVIGDTTENLSAMTSLRRIKVNIFPKKGQTSESRKCLDSICSTSLEKLDLRGSQNVGNELAITRFAASEFRIRSLKCKQKGWDPRQTNSTLITAYVHLTKLSLDYLGSFLPMFTPDSLPALHTLKIREGRGNIISSLTDRPHTTTLTSLHFESVGAQPHRIFETAVFSNLTRLYLHTTHSIYDKADLLRLNEFFSTKKLKRLSIVSLNLDSTLLRVSHLSSLTALHLLDYIYSDWANTLLTQMKDLPAVSNLTEFTAIKDTSVQRDKSKGFSECLSKTATNLRELTIAFADLSPSEQLSSFQSLTSLNLSHCLLRCEKDLKWLTDNNRWMLTNLNLSANALKDNFVLQLAKNAVMNRLRFLNLSKNKLTAKSVSTLFDSKPLHLEKLEMHNNSIGDIGVTVLSKWHILQYHSSLDLAYTNITGIGLNAIINSPYNAFLKELHFNGNGEITLKDAEAIVHSKLFQQCYTIEVSFTILDGAKKRLIKSYTRSSLVENVNKYVGMQLPRQKMVLG